jgi:alginate O-acetyltransferase complex protein AlgF
MRTPSSPSFYDRVLACALILALLLSSAFHLAYAGEAALYGPTAPPGSAFIRVFNASDADDVEARVGNETVPDIRAWSASEFIFLPAGTHALSAAGSEGPVTLAADRFYTAVVGTGAPRLLENDNSGNRLKALLIVYNLSGQERISLRTQDGATTVVEPVAKNASGTRQVNPAKVQLAVYGGDTKLADAPPMTLARGKAFSLFVVDTGTGPRLSWAVN